VMGCKTHNIYRDKGHNGVGALLKLTATTFIFWSLWFGVSDHLADLELMSILFEDNLVILKLLGVGVVVYSLGKLGGNEALPCLRCGMHRPTVVRYEPRKGPV